MKLITIISLCLFFAHAEKNAQAEASSIKNFSISVTPEIFGFYYRESVKSKYFMSNRGIMTGGVLDLRYAFNKNYLEFAARYAAGDAPYKSNGTGQCKKDPFWYHEFRGTHGYEIRIANAHALVPYWGYGYRYLKNDGRGLCTSTGHICYLRTSEYHYIPLGVTYVYEFSPCIKFKLVPELDIFLTGEQRSHLPYFTIVNDQDEGVGFRLSAAYEHDFQGCIFKVAPFLRYWRIEDSDVVHHPVYNCGFREPRNTTKEVGLSFGIRF